MTDYGDHEVAPEPLPSKAALWMVEQQAMAEARGCIIWCHLCMAPAKLSCAEFPHQ